MFGASEEGEEELAAARARLQKFEDDVSWRELMARLQASSPMHPFLLFRNGGIVLMALGFGGMVVVMLLSVLSRDFAETVGGIEAATIVPLPILLAVVGMIAAVVTALGFVGALSAGRAAPFLPHEAKVHQRLLSDVQQLEAKRSVKDRMTPRGATPRLLDRRNR